MGTLDLPNLNEHSSNQDERIESGSDEARVRGAALVETEVMLLG